MTLLEKVKEHLRESGYEEVEPGDQGGVWRPPDGEWTDKIIPTIVDCFERESMSDA